MTERGRVSQERRNIEDSFKRVSEEKRMKRKERMEKSIRKDLKGKGKGKEKRSEKENK